MNTVFFISLLVAVLSSTAKVFIKEDNTKAIDITEKVRFVSTFLSFVLYLFFV